MHTFSERHDTPTSTPDFWGTRCSVQRLPSHRSASGAVAPVELVHDPTAIHTLDAGHDTPRKLADFAPAGLAVVWIVQVVPFQRSAKTILMRLCWTSRRRCRRSWRRTIRPPGRFPARPQGSAFAAATKPTRSPPARSQPHHQGRGCRRDGDRQPRARSSPPSARAVMRGHTDLRSRMKAHGSPPRPRMTVPQVWSIAIPPHPQRSEAPTVIITERAPRTAFAIQAWTRNWKPARRRASSSTGRHCSRSARRRARNPDTRFAAHGSRRRSRRSCHRRSRLIGQSEIPPSVASTQAPSGTRQSNRVVSSFSSVRWT